MRWLQRMQEAEEAISRSRSAEEKKALEEKRKLLNRKEPNHYDFLEACAVYHVMKAYNSTRPAALHVNSTRGWRTVFVRLTNAKRDAKPRRTSPRAAPQVNGGAGSSANGGSQKRVRASKYSATPDGDTPWPASRVTAGAHALGRHGQGGKHRCDYPGCRIIFTNQGDASLVAAPPQAAKGGKKKAPKASDSSTPSGPGLPPGLTTRPTLPVSQGRGTAARSPSPAPSDGSTSSQPTGIVKLFCLECHDPSNMRPMNFHEDCWNRWHCIGPYAVCPPCPPRTPG